MHGVKFFPGGAVVYTPGTSTVEIHSVPTGPLVAGVLLPVVHGFGLNDIQLGIRETNNLVDVDILRVTGADPTNSVDVQVSVDLPGGLTIQIIGNLP